MSASAALVGLPSLSDSQVRNVAFIAAGLVAFIVFFIAARVASHLIAAQLSRRHFRQDQIVLMRRVVTVVVIAVGIFAAIGFATQTANVTLVGILLATVVAALGVQELLQDYVSGYYLLIERHLRVGDRIGFDEKAGTVSEIKLRVTLLRTEEGHLLVVPNSELFTKPVTIFTQKVEEPPPPPPNQAKAAEAPSNR